MATTNKNLNLPTYNQTVPTWDQPLNANFTIIDNAMGSSTSTINMAPGNYTLSTVEIQNMRIVLGGALVANRELVFPSGVGGSWIISNGTTNNYTITVKTAGVGTTVVAPQGFNLIVFSDGTNIYKADNGVTDGISYLPLTGGTLTGTLNGTNASFSGTMAITGATTIGGNTVGTNAYRDVTISASAPTGGNNGDIWYQV